MPIDYRFLTPDYLTWMDVVFLGEYLLADSFRIH